MPIQFNASSKHLDLFKNHKMDIVQTWIQSADVKQALSHHDITTDFFAKYFAVKVVDYALGIIEGDNKLGNCPVMGVMLVFFQKKNIPLEDVFTVCVNLKNTLIGFMLKQRILDEKILFEICGLIDHNFFGVIKEYLELHYNSNVEYNSCNLAAHSSPSHSIDGGSSIVTPISSMSASQYIKEIDINYDIMDELAELEEEALASLNLTEGFSNSIGHEVVGLFAQYAKMINQLVDFEELSYALFVLVDVLQNINFDDFENQTTYLQIYSKAIINDLAMWRTSVFMEKSAEDIHYLDKTLLSSIAQLQILLSPPDSNETEEIEFF